MTLYSDPGGTRSQSQCGSAKCSQDHHCAYKRRNMSTRHCRCVSTGFLHRYFGSFHSVEADIDVIVLWDQEMTSRTRFVTEGRSKQLCVSAQKPRKCRLPEQQMTFVVALAQKWNREVNSSRVYCHSVFGFSNFHGKKFPVPG